MGLAPFDGHTCCVFRMRLWGQVGLAARWTALSGQLYHGWALVRNLYQLVALQLVDLLPFLGGAAQGVVGAMSQRLDRDLAPK